ncbi:MAG TPA: PEP-utilizing enzyme [Polyangiaceae bacterium]
MDTEPKFEAPGPGPWEIEGAHFPRPLTRFVQEGILRAFPVGFAEGTARYGLLLSHFKPVAIHGFLYQQPIIFGAPEGALGPPPKAVLWLITRLLPKMRSRIETCRRAFESKQWRADLVQWDEVDKPAAIAQHLALQSVDPAALADDALLAHLARTRAHQEAMIVLHHRFTITCTIATGDYLAHTLEWTGASSGEALELLRGTSPISNGVAASELEALAASLRADPASQAILSDPDPANAVARLIAQAGEVGTRARAYLDIVRYRSIGYDLCDKTCGELPDVLIGAIRAVMNNRGSVDALRERESKERALRERVPAEHRVRFDELLTEARAVNRLRDERGVYSDGWATGIARRALLEAGRRLVQRGKLEAADHAVDLSLKEVEALFADQPGPSAKEVKERVTWRQTKTVADVPAWLNAPPAPPPPAHIFPAPARRAARAVDAVLSNLFKETEKESTHTIVRGISVNAGTHEGTARLVLDAADFGKIQQGDVLVTRATSPYFNVVLPLLGALVTDRGGQLCHAAIVAREYGIPGIVGTKLATQTIPDGARVRVDGATGEVTILPLVS